MTVRTAFSKLLRRPEFIVVGSLLLLSAVGLNGATEMLKLHFKKLPVALRVPLRDLPANLGNWRQTSLDNPLSHDMEEVLQTKNYIFRDYVDARKVSPSQLTEFDGKDYAQRDNMARNLQRMDPTSVIRLSVTYYTGMVDTVSHIPDRCFVADGFVPTDYIFPHWNLPASPIDNQGWRVGGDGMRVSTPAVKASSAEGGLPVRFINFEDQDNRARSKRNVVYFFNVNGRWVSAPDTVRIELQNLFQKHGYYAKVELMTTIEDRDTCERVMQDFMNDALPDIEKCLPDWANVDAEGVDAGTPVGKTTPGPGYLAPTTRSGVLPSTRATGG